MDHATIKLERGMGEASEKSKQKSKKSDTEN
jgi:hypothetical protein